MLLLQGKLRDQRNTILNLHSSIHGMQEELNGQKDMSQNLRKSLDLTQQELRDTMEKYRVELAYHHELLKRQQEALRLLYRSKFRNDFLLDCAILLGSTWFCVSPVIDYPLKLVLNSTVGLILRGRLTSKGTKRLADFLYSIARIILIWQSYQGVRGQALKFGLHNGLGSWIPYVNNWFLKRNNDSFQHTILPPNFLNDSIQEK
jgi:hypothetical protein